MASSKFTNIISPAELNALLTQESVKLIDCRFDLQSPHYGINGYRQGHIREAVFLDVGDDLSAPHIKGVTGRHPLPDRQAFAERVKRIGLSPVQQVVVYDQGGGYYASRAWWMLRWVGFENVAVLDGGLSCWTNEGFTLTTQVPSWPQAMWELGEDPHMTIDAMSLEKKLFKLDLLDARSIERFAGEKEPIDPVAGHIPGAVCADFDRNTQADGRFHPPAKLRARFLGLLKGNGKDAVCYCGSGITATHNILAMEIAGMGMPKLYPGSWSEWITDGKRPIETST